MTEANPPAQPEELRRRILLYLSKADGQDDYRHLFQIATDFGETPKEIRDQLEILESQGLVDVDFFTNGNALPTITGKGKLEVEKIAQEAPQPDSPPSSEPSPESQEFEHSVDYRRVDWQGKKFRFSPMQSRVVRLLHEEFKEGRDELGAAVLLEGSDSTGKYLRDIFRRHCAWGTLIIEGENKGTHKLSLSH